MRMPDNRVKGVVAEPQIIDIANFATHAIRMSKPLDHRLCLADHTGRTVNGRDLAAVSLRDMTGDLAGTPANL